MEIKLIQTLLDDKGEEITQGTSLMLTIGRRSVIAVFDSITSKGTIRFINPVTDEKFSVRLSSITKCERCTFKIDIK